MTRKQIDWESLEIQYRAGLRSLKDMGAEYGVSDAAIIKRAKRDGWVRDLRAKIQAKAQAKVSDSVVSVEVRARTKVREHVVVEANATVLANILLELRTNIRRARILFQNLLAELEAQVAAPGLFEQLGELLDESDDGDESGRVKADKLNEIYRKVISLPSRVESAKKLTETLEKLVKMEREAFGLNNADPGDGDSMAGGRTITDAERAVRLIHFLRQGNLAA